MECLGGITYLERLDNIKLQIREYYGELNELKLGATRKVPTKPSFLSAYEMINKLRIPLVDGGLMDQPSLWLLEYEIIEQEITLMEAINKNADGDGK